MKQLRFGVGVVLMIAVTASAQEFKIARATGKLDVKDLNEVQFVGASGNEIVFTSRNRDRDNDERAKGLRAIGAMGLEDNTGLGISVVEKGDVIEVRQLRRMDDPNIKIAVPKGVSISYSHSSPHGEDVTFTNIEGEIEASTVHGGCYLENPKGPITVSTVHGEIEVKLSESFKSPISLAAVHGLVDLTVPVSAKVDFKMSTKYGEIFVDPDFKLQLESKDGLVSYGNTVRGKLNGGGQDITLTSNYGSVYVRKKQ